MNVLGSVLPGVRALRAPFAAGAVTLLALWLLVEDHLPDDPGANGIYEALLQLRAVTSAIGPTALVAFAAYLLGALVTTATDIVASYFFGIRIGWLANRANDFGREESRKLLSRVPESDLRDDLVARWNHLYHPEAATRRKRLRSIQQEWRLVRLRLLREHPEAFTEVDRLDAEGEFRRALIGPVIFLGGVVCVRLEGAAAVLAGGISLMLAGFLYIAARQMTVEAEQAMADLVVDGPVTLPIIAAMKAAATPSDVEPASASAEPSTSWNRRLGCWIHSQLPRLCNEPPPRSVVGTGNGDARSRSSSHEQEQRA